MVPLVDPKHKLMVALRNEVARVNTIRIGIDRSDSANLLPEFMLRRELTIATAAMRDNNSSIMLRLLIALKKR